MSKQRSDLGQLLIDFIKANPRLSSKQIHEGMHTNMGYATIKREIQKLLAEGLIVAIGRGKSTRYEISKAFELIHPIDIELYFLKEIDDRNIKLYFDHSLIKETLRSTPIFTTAELIHLNNLQNTFTGNVSKLSQTQFKKEFERLAIDLSWKSSQIEGNTYSLLETEKLLKEQETATGKTKDEAIMLLNHKAALDFILDHPAYLQPVSLAAIEDIHSILIKELDVDRNVRNRRIGITGTNYQPLDNEFQIKEAMGDMCALINRRENIFEKALLAIALISYIQPFVDDNKRTARIITNAILINHNYCPISFRTVNSMDYKKAMLIFYEQNNISAFKKIFMDQFEFAVKAYF
jgi:Fic family protein